MHRNTLTLPIALLLAACSGGGEGPGPQGNPNTPGGPTGPTGGQAPSAIAIAPAVAAAGPGGNTVAFSASSELGQATPVTWRVNGVLGGDATVGLISSTGVYSPGAGPAGADTLIVTATSTLDATKVASATLVIVPTLAQRDYYYNVPRIHDLAAPRRMRLIFVPAAGASGVTFIRRDGTTQAFASLGNGVYSYDIDPSLASAGYVATSLHNFIGFARPEGIAGAGQINQIINVRDAALPAVPVTPLSAGAQRTDYVLNIRTDALFANGIAPAALTSQAIATLGDRFDFVLVVQGVRTTNNRSYSGYRNDISGIGIAPFNNSASVGSAGRIRGVINYPIDTFLDGASDGVNHEIGHSWINFGDVEPWLSGVPHWPVSSLAQSVMGFSIPGSGAGGSFSFALTDLGNGTARVDQATASQLYSPWDLYLMGLIPASEVPPALIFQPSKTIQEMVSGSVHPVVPVTIATYIAAHGARSPSSAAAPREFSMAVVVTSVGRLLSAAEMAYFDANVRRAELTVPVVGTAGVVNVTALPFFLATGGRATLVTRLP